MATTYLRKKVNQNFTIVSNEVIRDKNLSWKATGFLAYLLSCADGWELNFEDLKKRKKDGLTATRTAAEELKNAGYLSIKKIRDEKGRIISFDWIVTDIPNAENPDLDYPYVDFPYVDNRTQRSTNSKSTSLNKKQQQPVAKAPDCSGSGSCNLIFDKVIDQSLHQKLYDLLVNVEAALAQQMLDVLAQKIKWGIENSKFKVESPVGLVGSFVKNPNRFDPTPGFTIARKRENDKVEAEKRRMDKEHSAKQKDFEGYQKFKKNSPCLENTVTAKFILNNHQN